MEEIKELLAKDPVRNINLLHFMENYRILRTHREGTSVLVEGVSDKHWIYISSTDGNELHSLMEKYRDPGRDRNFAVIEPWMEKYILRGTAGIDWELRCEKLYLPPDAELQMSGIPLVTLDSVHSRYIYDNYEYKDYLESRYIRERIDQGPAYAVFQKERPAAWIMTHDDGAIGLLHVMPEYRGRGFARALLIHISDFLRRQGRLPFLHIEPDNAASLSLAQSVGYIRHSSISWFGTLYSRSLSR